MSHFRGRTEQRTYEGIDGARLFIREGTAAFDDWAIELEAIHDAGDTRVVGVPCGHGSKACAYRMSTGTPAGLERPRCQVRMEMYDDPDDALKAVGLDDVRARRLRIGRRSLTSDL